MLKNFILLFFLSSFLKCQTTNTIIFSVDGKSFEFEIYENSQEYYENGMIKKCQLSKIQKIQDYHCKDWIYFSKSGSLLQFELASAYKFGTSEIPKNATVFLRDNKTISSIWLSKESYINGIRCAGEYKTPTLFFENGNTSLCYLLENTTLQGYPCAANISKPVCFYQSGKIKSFTLAKDFIYKNYTYKKGSTILVEPFDKIICVK